MLIIFGIIVSAQQWVGQPIECWVPPQFTPPWEEYVENYCFVQNTYWLPFNSTIPRAHSVRKDKQLGNKSSLKRLEGFFTVFFHIINSQKNSPWAKYWQGAIFLAIFVSLRFF